MPWPNNITDHLDGLAALGKGQRIRIDMLPSTPCGSTNPFPIGKSLDKSLSLVWTDLVNSCQTATKNDTALQLCELNQ